MIIVIPFITLPKTEKAAVHEVPPRLARIMLEEKKPPPPPPPKVEKTKPEIVKPEIRPQPKPVPQVDKQQKIRDQTAQMLKDELADLRDNSVIDKATKTKNLTGKVNEDSHAERSLLTSKVGASSGGINTSNLSRGYGGGPGSLTGHETTAVTSALGSTDGSKDVRRTSSSTKAARSREEIELIFDRNKGAIYALYSRALRDNPALQGKVVLQLTITPQGDVTNCTILSSELNNPELESKLKARVMLFKFEARDVETITTTKPIDFFPA
jgi:TonB family protein